MKGEIIAIRTLYNDDGTLNCYEIIIDTNNKPNLKIGKCEVSQ